MRSRLLLLVGLLIFVFFLMGEARKPENYHWLTRLQGGGQAPKAPSQAGPRPSLVDAETGTKFLDITDTMPNRPAVGTRPATVQEEAKPAEAKRNQELSAGPLGLHPESALDFELPAGIWVTLLNSLTQEDRGILFQLLRTAQPSSANETAANFHPLDQAAAIALLGKLNSQVSDWFAGQLERSRGGEPTKPQTDQAAAAVEFKAQWDIEFFPVLQHVCSGKPLNEPQANSLKSVRQQVYRQALSLIQDGTEVARPGDSLAWLLAWQQLLQAPLGGTTAVTPYELMTQPKQFRGRPVSFSGTLRGIETAAANQQELGISQYYVLWIQPKELDRTPYCVYAAELPAELRPTGDKFELTKQPITVRGLFWKVRTYVDTTKAIATCPLVLARNVVLTSAPVAAEPYRWKPPAWLLWSISLLLPLVALGIAWRIYQTGKEFMTPRSPGRTRLILDSLEELGADSSIQSARESLARLESTTEQPNQEQ